MKVAVGKCYAHCTEWQSRVAYPQTPAVLGGSPWRSPPGSGAPYELAGTTWRPRVGERVRVVPNHVCASVALMDRLWAMRGDAVLHPWEVKTRGWGVPGVSAS